MHYVSYFLAVVYRIRLNNIQLMKQKENKELHCKEEKIGASETTYYQLKTKIRKGTSKAHLRARRKKSSFIHHQQSSPCKICCFDIAGSLQKFCSHLNHSLINGLRLILTMTGHAEFHFNLFLS